MEKKQLFSVFVTCFVCITKTCPCDKQRFFSVVKNKKFHQQNFDIFLIFAQNIDCGYSQSLMAAPVAEWLRSLASVLLIIRLSHRCGFAPRTGHEFICETSHVLLAGVLGVFCPGTLVFAPPTD